MRGERGMSDVVETTSDKDGGAQRGGARARGTEGRKGSRGGRRGAKRGRGCEGCKGARGV